MNHGRLIENNDHKNVIIYSLFPSSSQEVITITGKDLILSTYVNQQLVQNNKMIIWILINNLPLPTVIYYVLWQYWIKLFNISNNHNDN